MRTTITIPYTDLYQLLEKKDSMRGIVDYFLSKRKELKLVDEFTSINEDKMFINYILESE